MDDDRRLDRRRLLLAGAGLLALGSACSADDEAPPTGRRTTTGATTSRGPTPPQATVPGPTSPGASATTDTSAPSTQPTSPFPKPRPWTPSAGDRQPRIKVTAARVVEAIGTWAAGQGGQVSAARRVDALGQDGRLGRASYPSLHPDAEASALEVIEAQYGGLLTSTASVLVVCRQWLADQAGQVTASGTTVDVRLSRRGLRWQVTEVRPGVLPSPASRPAPLARQVLSQPRIDLPPAARADVASGNVHAGVLTAMLRLARTYRIGVSVVRTGHPTNVFGTDGVSDHTQWRAFDTWRVNGRLVVDPSTPRALVTGYMAAAGEAGAYNVGGPYAMTDGATNFFTDAAHSDHVHVAFPT